MSEPDVAGAVGRLDALTRILRVQCPWDREQDERSIVPHTVEEAYELADAAHAGDDAKLVDELGDVLFQVHFLSLLLEERGAGDMAQVADQVREKLIRRHPHVFGEAAPDEDERSSSGEGRPDAALSSGDVLARWDRIKATEPGREPGIFGEVPENLPALLHARKVQRRAASSGLDMRDVEVAAEGVAAQAQGLAGLTRADRDAAFAQVGDLLFAAANIARLLHVDPELALRDATRRFRTTVETAEARARADGHDWAGLDADAKLHYYALTRMESP